jgi:hypothetical protein
MHIIVIVLIFIIRTIDTPFLLVQFYTAVLQPHIRGDSLRDIHKVRTILSAASVFGCL